MEREESHRIRADQLATMVSGRLVGDPGASVSEVASLVSSGNEDLSFFADPRYLGLYDETKAGIVLLSEESEGIRTDLARIVVENPHESFMSVVRTFRPAPAPPDPGVHPEAVVDKTAKIDPTAFVGPCVVVEKGAHIGPHTVVRAGCYVGESVILGSHCCLEPSVVLYPGTKLGEGVVVASNTVIGADGFGFSRNEAGEWSEVPQTGGVLIADNVHIGATIVGLISIVLLIIWGLKFVKNNKNGYVDYVILTSDRIPININAVC